jgi:hypothetical protein
MEQEQIFIRILAARGLTIDSLEERETAIHVPRLIFLAWQLGKDKEFRQWLLTQNLHHYLKLAIAAN